MVSAAAVLGPHLPVWAVLAPTEKGALGLAVWQEGASTSCQLGQYAEVAVCFISE